MANPMDEILSPFQGVTGPSDPLPPQLYRTPPEAMAEPPPVNMPTPSLEETQGNVFAGAGQLQPTPPPAPVAAPGVEQPVTLQPPAPMPPPKPTGTGVPAQSTAELGKLKTERDAIYEKSLELVDAQANIEREKASEIALANEDARYQMQKQREADAVEAKRITDDAKKAADDREMAVQDFNKQRKRDPHADVSVGQSILAAIAQGLGAFGSALTGGPNHAANIVAKAAEMRVRKWERDLDESKDGVKLKDNRVAYFRQQGLDQAAASRAALATLLDQGAEEVDRIKAQYGSDEVQQRAEAIKLGLGEKRNAMRLAEEQAAIAARTKAFLASQPKPMAVGDQIRLRGLEVEVPQGNGAKVIFRAKSEPEAKAIRDAQKVAEGVKSDLKVLRSLMQGSPSLNPQTAQKVEILNNSIRKKYIKLDELGVPTGKDLELSSVVGDPTKWTQTTGQTKELINRVEADLADRLVSAYSVQGFEGAQ
jgi:hypothetical protein